MPYINDHRDSTLDCCYNPRPFVDPPSQITKDCKAYRLWENFKVYKSESADLANFIYTNSKRTFQLDSDIYRSFRSFFYWGDLVSGNNKIGHFNDNRKCNDFFLWLITMPKFAFHVASRKQNRSTSYVIAIHPLFSIQKVWRYILKFLAENITIIADGINYNFHP